MNKGLTLLLVLGIFISSAALLASHYYNLPDLMYGTFVGIGLGAMILSLKVRINKLKEQR